MSHPALATTTGLALGVVTPAGAAFANWRGWIGDYTALVAAVTATLIAIWWLIRVMRSIHASYVAIFGSARDRPRGSLDDGDDGEL